MPTYKDVDEIMKEIETGKKNLHFKNAENAEICASVFDFVAGVIDRIPAADDVVEVVRCKDCKHWIGGFTGSTENVKRCEYAHYLAGGNGYCVYGERKEVQE